MRRKMRNCVRTYLCQGKPSLLPTLPITTKWGTGTGEMSRINKVMDEEVATTATPLSTLSSSSLSGSLYCDHLIVQISQQADGHNLGVHLVRISLQREHNFAIIIICKNNKTYAKVVLGTVEYAVCIPEHSECKTN